MLRSTYNTEVGFSDHTLGIEAASAAVALGARIFEKHFTFDKKQDGPDHQASASPEELRCYVESLRSVYKGLGDGKKKIMPCEVDNRQAFRRYLVTARPIAAGTTFSFRDFVSKKVNSGISPDVINKIVGRKAAVDIAEDVPFMLEYLDGKI